MRLDVTRSRKDGGWEFSGARLFDGGAEFGLDPNKPGSIRIYNESGTGWRDFDMERLTQIHRLLWEAKDNG